MTRVASPPRQRIRPWLLPAAAVLLGVVLLWAGGGLRTVETAQGRTAAADQTITLERWRLVIHDVALTDLGSSGSEARPALRVSLTATFTGTESVYGLGIDLVTVETLTGPAGIDRSPSRNGPRTGDFDPDVPQQLTLDFRWPDIPRTAPDRVRVLVRDEKLDKVNFISEREWHTDAIAAHLDLPCPDRRETR